ncbi:PHP domain-containing protein [Thermosyntropha lipolytica DSM 11003]|uniref:PHP domain-containing protein n=1 Tax=Thermosyntropha lipolytica DSM 11003 TaxID=1123382 RepID=A0A1M5NZ32_9FIRM|nr:CehA/McbA family metallohydrolase [Thermosyntropha lipolytica]SHG94758.1 PHP domain-containing protein [Thermosyntropha lipolytica DSM 11003]
MYEYVGNLHIHSVYSDGTGTVAEIAKKAQRAGLDFVVITDHENMRGFKKGEEGYYNKVLVLIGMEINDTCCHYLALNIKEEIENNTLNPQQVIDQVNEQGGIGIIAHPFEKGSPFYARGIAFPWNQWQVKGFQGIEIWNFCSGWKDNLESRLKAIFLLFWPRFCITGPDKEALKKLDFLQGQGEKVAAFGGSDAHNIRFRLGFIPVMVGSYLKTFRSVNMHILLKEKLTGDYKKDKVKIYEALRQGRSWVADDYRRNSRGFSFNLKYEDRTWTMGDEVEYREGMWIEVFTPHKSRVRLIHNGQRVAVSQGRKHVFKSIEKGVYRIEADYMILGCYRPWIYSNSIFLV